MKTVTIKVWYVLGWHQHGPYFTEPEAEVARESLDELATIVIEETAEATPA